MLPKRFPFGPFVRGSLSPLWRPLTALTLAFGLAGQPAGAADELDARRQQVANMSLGEQQQLVRSQQRFNELSEADQNRMRKLDADLRTDPDRERLQQVLERYHEWLKTLSPEKRAELLELSGEDRIRRIQELMARQREERTHRHPRGSGPPLPKEDQQAIYKWFSELVWQRRRQLLDEIPPPRRKEVERLDETMQRKTLLLAAMQRGRGERFPIEQADYERLLKELTPETRDRLAQASSPQAKQRLAREWIGQALIARMGWHAMRRAMVSVSDEELHDFFKQLPEADRQRLMRLPRESMQEELKHLYLWRENRTDSPPFGRPSFGHRGPPGRRGPDWHRPPGEPGSPGNERRGNDE